MMVGQGGCTNGHHGEDCTEVRAWFESMPARVDGGEGLDSLSLPGVGQRLPLMV